MGVILGKKATKLNVPEYNNKKHFDTQKSSSDQDYTHEPSSKGQRSAGHCDFTDKQNKLFTVQYAVSLTVKGLIQSQGDCKSLSMTGIQSID